MLAVRRLVPVTAPLAPRLIVWLTLPPLLWAGNAVLGRLMVGQVPPLTLNFLRWLITALLLLPLAWRVLQRLPEVRARWRYLLLIGLLGVGLFNSLQYMALVTSTALNVTLVGSSMPVWMLVVGVLFFGQRPQRRQWLAAALGLAGVLLVIARGSWQTLLAVHFVSGDPIRPLFTLPQARQSMRRTWISTNTRISPIAARQIAHPPRPAVVPACSRSTAFAANRIFERLTSATTRALGSPKTPHTSGSGRQPANAYVFHSRRSRFVELVIQT